VPGHLHRNALGNSGAHQVSHRRSSKIMRNPDGAARLRACLPPRLPRKLDTTHAHALRQRRAWCAHGLYASRSAG
jgi:hypothetical protein